jgi:glutaredoxin
MNIKKLFNKKQITVYTSENCPYCKNTKDKLSEAGIKYLEKDIKEYEDDWNQLVRLTNMPITPGVIFGDNHLFPSRDFPNPDILVKILEDLKDVKSSYSLQTLERIKTLNYHISTAFNGLNQRLKAIEDQLQTKQSKTKKKKNVNKSTN